MPKREYRGTDFWHAMRVELFADQGGGCPWCLHPLNTYGEVATHHRRRRLGRDDDDKPWNLLLLHGACHREVHASPTFARERGFIVSAWADPGEVAKPSLAVLTSPQSRRRVPFE